MKVKHMESNDLRKYRSFLHWLYYTAIEMYHFARKEVISYLGDISMDVIKDKVSKYLSLAYITELLVFNVLLIVIIVSKIIGIQLIGTKLIPHVPYIITVAVISDTLLLYILYKGDKDNLLM